jgi:hypothetical protein
MGRIKGMEKSVQVENVVAPKSRMHKAFEQIKRWQLDLHCCSMYWKIIKLETPYSRLLNKSRVKHHQRI